MPRQQRISKADRPHLRKIVRSHVTETLAHLDSFMADSRWLAKTNRYSERTVARLTIDAKRSIRKRHLAQYISASSILHCADGWSYLGRAINCLLKGDPHRVVHLAYYAELRAALSLLACEGIGVFKDLHFIIDAPHSASPLPSKPHTHVAAWTYLRYWSNLKRSADLFSDVIVPGGTSLTTWFESQGGVDKFVRPQARVWFNQWSMDLGLFTDDRDARNESSYRPDGIPEPWYLSAAAALDLATDLWQACEPAINGSFDGIDRHILRIAIEKAFEGVTGLKPAIDQPRFAAFVDSIVDPLDFENSVAEEWKLFFRRLRVAEDPKIFFFSGQDPLDKSLGHAALLARATLLLRLATGSVLKLIRSAGISGDKLQFWWGQLGINRGLWDGVRDRAELLDLWDDIVALFDDIQTFQSDIPTGEQTFQLIGKRIPQVVTGLGGCERVAIWSLTP
jgi:hypothetical protein